MHGQAFFSCGKQGLLFLQYSDFLMQWLLLLQSTNSRHTGTEVVAHGLSSCDLWALGCGLSSRGARA